MGAGRRLVGGLLSRGACSVVMSAVFLVVLLPVVAIGPRAVAQSVDDQDPAAGAEVSSDPALVGGELEPLEDIGTGELIPAGDLPASHISDVATDPASRVVREQGRDVFLRGVRDGSEIEVLLRDGEIWTAYPIP